jgi:biopolymer transport protein ExbB
MSESIVFFVVKGTFGLLLLASVVTWALVLLKARQRWVARRLDRRFRRANGDVIRIGALRGIEGQHGPAWRVARAGLGALIDFKTPASRADVEAAREAAEHALKQQIQRERRTAEGGLAVLASIGSTSPFVGLFGTVWGIISALRAIGHSGSASLEVVAGPIGEALVATGIGIAVAVPAVLAYNAFVRGLKVQTADLEQLGASFLHAIGRDDERAAIEPTRLRVERAPVDGQREATV